MSDTSKQSQTSPPALNDDDEFVGLRSPFLSMQEDLRASLYIGLQDYCNVFWQSPTYNDFRNNVFNTMLILNLRGELRQQTIGPV